MKISLRTFELLSIFLLMKEFFEKMANELQGQHEWREWFALPFLILPTSIGGGYGNIDRY